MEQLPAQQPRLRVVLCCFMPPSRPTWGEGQWDEREVIRHTKSSWLAGMGQDHSGSNNNMSHCIPNLSRQRRLCCSVYFSQFVLLYAFDKLSGLVPPRTIFPPKKLPLPASHMVQFLVSQEPAVLIRTLHVFHNNSNTFCIISPAVLRTGWAAPQILPCNVTHF